jgi:hypothetical protein
MADFDGIDDDDEQEKSSFDRSRTEYTGVELRDELQPVDEVELEEEGLQLDDPEQPNRRRAALDPAEVGWDLDSER